MPGDFGEPSTQFSGATADPIYGLKKPIGLIEFLLSQSWLECRQRSLNRLGVVLHLNRSEFTRWFAINTWGKTRIRLGALANASSVVNETMVMTVLFAVEVDSPRPAYLTKQRIPNRASGSRAGIPYACAPLAAGPWSDDSLICRRFWKNNAALPNSDPTITVKVIHKES